MKIVHLSDLHLSGGLSDSRLGDAVVSHVNHVRPDVTVVTGDLTAGGGRSEFDLASRFLARLVTQSLLVVPGNRDARNGGYVRFEEVFGTRYPAAKNDLVTICGIDSSQPDINEGRVGRSNLAQIADTVSVEGKVRILAMHHHPVHAPDAGCGAHGLDDAGEVQALCAETEMDIVLSGRRHQAGVCRRGHTLFVAAGTATQWKPGARSFPSFNVIHIEDGTITVQLVDVSEGWGTQTIAVALVRPGVVTPKAQPRVTPPFAFEAEEFGSQIPDENWRHRLGVPQLLEFPARPVEQPSRSQVKEPIHVNSQR